MSLPLPARPHTPPIPSQDQIAAAVEMRSSTPPVHRKDFATRSPVPRRSTVRCLREGATLPSRTVSLVLSMVILFASPSLIWILNSLDIFFFLPPLLSLSLSEPQASSLLVSLQVMPALSNSNACHKVLQAVKSLPLDLLSGSNARNHKLAVSWSTPDWQPCMIATAAHDGGCRDRCVDYWHQT